MTSCSRLEQVRLVMTFRLYGNYKCLGRLQGLEKVENKPYRYRELGISAIRYGVSGILKCELSRCRYLGSLLIVPKENLDIISMGRHPRALRQALLERLICSTNLLHIAKDTIAAVNLKKRLQRGRKFHIIATAFATAIMHAPSEMSLIRIGKIGISVLYPLALGLEVQVVVHHSSLVFCESYDHLGELLHELNYESETRATHHRRRSMPTS